MAQEKGSKEHQTDILAETETQETIHNQETTIEKETTVRREEEETMETEPEHMKRTAIGQTTETSMIMTGERDQGKLLGKIGEVKIKPERNIGYITRETEKAIAPKLKEIETTQDTETTLNKETETIPETEKTEASGKTQDQGQLRIKDLETTPDQERTPGTETIPETEETKFQEIAQTTTEEDKEKTKGTLEAKAETETHGGQYLNTKGI